MNFNEQFLFEDQNIVSKIKQTVHHRLWPSRDINSVDMFILDMQPNKDGELVLLVAAMNLEHTPQILYALITLTEQQQCFHIKEFCQIKISAFYSGDANQEWLKYKFILADDTAYIYGERTIFEVLLRGKHRSSKFDDHLCVICFLFRFTDVNSIQFNRRYCPTRYRKYREN